MLLLMLLTDRARPESQRAGTHTVAGERGEFRTCATSRSISTLIFDLKLCSIGELTMLSKNFVRAAYTTFSRNYPKMYSALPWQRTTKSKRNFRLESAYPSPPPQWKSTSRLKADADWSP